MIEKIKLFAIQPEEPLPDSLPFYASRENFNELAKSINELIEDTDNRLTVLEEAVKNLPYEPAINDLLQRVKKLEVESPMVHTGYLCDHRQLVCKNCGRNMGT